VKQIRRQAARTRIKSAAALSAKPGGRAKRGRPIGDREAKSAELNRGRALRNRARGLRGRFVAQGCGESRMLDRRRYLLLREQRGDGRDGSGSAVR